VLCPTDREGEGLSEKALLQCAAPSASGRQREVFICDLRQQSPQNPACPWERGVGEG
jgi:hypothetical protein